MPAESVHLILSRLLQAVENGTTTKSELELYNKIVIITSTHYTPTTDSVTINVDKNIFSFIMLGMHVATLLKN